MSSAEENGLPALPDRWPRWVYGAGQDAEARLIHLNARALQRRLALVASAGAAGLAATCLLGGAVSPGLALGLIGAGGVLATAAALRWAHDERDLRIATARAQSRRALRKKSIPQPQPDRSTTMATYRMVYGDDEIVVRETYEHIDEVVREDGWLVLFRGPDAILRVREEHVHEMEELAAREAPTGPADPT